MPLVCVDNIPHRKKCKTRELFGFAMQRLKFFLGMGNCLLSIRTNNETDAKHTLVDLIQPATAASSLYCLPQDVIDLLIQYLSLTNQATLMAFSTTCRHFNSLSADVCTLFRAIHFMKHRYAPCHRQRMETVGLIRWTREFDCIDKHTAFSLWSNASPELQNLTNHHLSWYTTENLVHIELTVHSVFTQLWNSRE